ncbi:MAG: TlpA family protein disulfide reductase, partial [Flavobacterium sp.]
QGKWDEILKKFKGKVIYVDFWATWCAPCREGIEEIAPLKEKLDENKIAFVYITNQSSPLDIYKNMLPAIKGNHFRLSNDEWNVISEKFKIGGIPRYLLVGKYGRVINDNLPPLKNEELKERLLTATKL